MFPPNSLRRVTPDDTLRHGRGGEERGESEGRSRFGLSEQQLGDVAQLEEHLLCKQGAVGSSPIVSTDKTPGQMAYYS